jgi:CMP-N-acetylneuraminic acid synthetase
MQLNHMTLESGSKFFVNVLERYCILPDLIEEEFHHLAELLSRKCRSASRRQVLETLYELAGTLYLEAVDDFSKLIGARDD